MRTHPLCGYTVDGIHPRNIWCATAYASKDFEKLLASIQEKMWINRLKRFFCDLLKDQEK